MKPDINILDSIKKVSPPDELFAKIKLRIAQEAPQKLAWAKVAAVAMVFFFSAEIYTVIKTQTAKNSGIEMLASQTDNSLYND